MLNEAPSSRLATFLARDLFSHLAAGCNGTKKLASMSVCAYDTAWVSMVRRSSGEYAFPESFSALLAMQDPSGGWGSGGTAIDAILNTMAAILALKSRVLEGEAQVQDDIHRRVECATAFLAAALDAWDVETTDHVGFEILVPRHLSLLADHGILFTFPAQERLSALNRAKMAGFRPELLYSETTTTMEHSLEAFVGQIDFDRVKHHVVDGGLMGSPSSSAAYLMHGSQWDNSTEAFIRDAIANGEGQGCGAVPSAFPITIFEITWVVSTLLMNGVNLDEIDGDDNEAIASFLDKEFKGGNGTLGFVPGFLIDADDTSKAITSLRLLGKEADPRKMLETFSAGEHFMTYVGERNPSFSANCNILNALIHCESSSSYAAQIELALVYLCKLHTTGNLTDKWNVSPLYAQMLFAETLAATITMVNSGKLQGLSEQTVANAHISLLEIIIDALSSQGEDGSWGNGTLEITAYATILLAAGSNTSVVSSFQDHLKSSIVRARSFLSRDLDKWGQPVKVWVEKVSYGSPILSQTYCIAALKAKTFQAAGSSAKETAILAEMKKMAKFYRRLPLFSAEPMWRIEASLAQSLLWYPRLASQRHLVFPRDGMEEDKYLRYIPATWTLTNNLQANSRAISTSVMWEMMILSMLNYQADEFFETAVEEHLMDQLPAIRRIIHELCKEPPEHRQRSSTQIHNSNPDTNHPTTQDARASTTNGSASTQTNGTAAEAGDSHSNDSTSKFTLPYVQSVLSAYTTHILFHPSVLSSPLSVRVALHRELETFMLAHLDQAIDNSRFRSQTLAADRTTPFFSERSSYYSWVRSTSADHTSCPFSFRFYCCLIAKNPGSAVFEDPRQLYVAEDLCRHLATMCRQYNDFGSIARDRAEKNLNSVNFPEFSAHVHRDKGADGGVGKAGVRVKSEDEIKADLFWIAEYERDGCISALARLEESEKGAKVDRRVMRLLRAFVDVTDSYGQIYVARDIASRMK